MRPLLTGAGVLLVAVVLAFVAARLAENSMIFFPARYPLGEWDAAAAGARDVYFDTADRVRLHAWWFEAQPVDGAPPPVVLFTHGNGGNLTGRASHARALAGAGVSVFVFDYRGYGRSAGSPDEAGIYVDTDTAYELLTDEWGVPPERLVLLGVSLGSAPASRLAARAPHAGLVLVAPLPSARRMARRMFGGLPIDLLIRSRFPVVDWVAARRRPLLVVHGDRDEVIPLAYGREVFDAAADPKEFLLLPGTGHNDVLEAGGRTYVDAVAGFVHRVADSGR